jgi:hypothetical protein
MMAAEEQSYYLARGRNPDTELLRVIMIVLTISAYLLSART